MRKVVVLAIFFVAILVGCVEKEGKVYTMNIYQLVEDVENERINETHYIYVGFKTLKPGDTLVIEDEIAEKREAENYSLILMTSMPEAGFYFETTLPDFQQGDKIRITLHVEKDIYQQFDGQYTWTIEREVFKEGWDFETHTPKPFPPDTIEHM